MPAPASAPLIESAVVPARILRQARLHFFAHGYSGFRMDDLATELGMSKKTLYVHFAGKDKIIAAIIDDIAAEVRREADALLRDRRLSFAGKLRGFVESMAARLARLHPRTMRDLQRFAPDLYSRLEAVRQKNIPYVFGRFVAEGQAAGLVRTDFPSALAIEFFLQAMQGLVSPASLERLKLAPKDIIPQGIALFFGGLLTISGQKQYEKIFPR